MSLNVKHKIINKTKATHENFILQSQKCFQMQHLMQLRAPQLKSFFFIINNSATKILYENDKSFVTAYANSASWMIGMTPSKEPSADHTTGSGQYAYTSAVGSATIQSYTYKSTSPSCSIR